MKTLAAHLDQSLRAAGIAVDGVTIGDESDRQTWRVHPKRLQAEAQPLIDAFEVPDPKILAAAEADAQHSLPALALALWECIPHPTMTRAELLARITAIEKLP